MPKIRKVYTPADIEQAVATLVLAFNVDPVARWMYGEARHYLSHFGSFIRAFAGRAFAAGTAFAGDDGTGAALWLPPGIPIGDAALAAVLAETLTPDKYAALGAAFERTTPYRPTGPHWYLPLIGVDPLHRNRGTGSALLRHALRQCDQDHVPAYLEATTPAAARLYERHGFEALATIPVAPSCAIVPMLRTAR